MGAKMSNLAKVLLSIAVTGAVSATSFAASLGNVDYSGDNDGFVLVTRGLETFAAAPGTDIFAGDILTNTLSSTAIVTALGCSVEMNKAEQIIVDDNFCDAGSLIKISDPLNHKPIPSYQAQTGGSTAGAAGSTGATTTTATTTASGAATTSTATAASGVTTTGTVSGAVTTTTATTAAATTAAATTTAATTGIVGAVGGLGVVGATAAVVATAAIISDAVSN